MSGISLTHTTVVTTPNDPAKEVSSDAWNAEHQLVMDAGYLVGRAPGSPTSGPAQQITVGSGLSLSAAGELEATAGSGLTQAQVLARVCLRG